MEELSVSRWSVGRWSTCCLIGGWLLVVDGSVEHLPVGLWSVVGSKWMGGALVSGSVVGVSWSVGR